MFYYQYISAPSIKKSKLKKSKFPIHFFFFFFFRFKAGEAYITNRAKCYHIVQTHQESIPPTPSPAVKLTLTRKVVACAVDMRSVPWAALRYCEWTYLIAEATYSSLSKSTSPWPIHDPFFACLVRFKAGEAYNQQGKMLPHRSIHVKGTSPKLLSKGDLNKQGCCLRGRRDEMLPETTQHYY